MDDVIEKAIQRVIDSMHENLDQQLTVDDMARIALFSKFHFSRIFLRVTGTSPGRFLTALRIQKAKDLLVSTSLNVKDISHEVGYSSVGTFSSRFSNSVGVPPGRFRQLGGHPPQLPTQLPTNRRPRSGRARVRGEIWSPSNDKPGLIFVGLFPNRVPHSLPVTCTVLTRPGPFVLENTPPGVWYLFAHAVAAERENTTHPQFSGEQTLSVGNHGPILIQPDTTVRHADVRLTPVRPFDPPVLLALLNEPPSAA